MVKPIDVFRMPTPVTVMGRSSSITNSFVNGIIPAREPSNDDIAEALAILGLDPEDLRCAYCDDRSTEWDHFRPLIQNQEPTGYISEIQNLVPACGKCNQSKGNREWRSWMNGSAPRCPRARGVTDIEARIARLEHFEGWRTPTKLDIPTLVGAELWERYRANWSALLQSMRTSDQLAREVRIALQKSMVPSVQQSTSRQPLAPPAPREIVPQSLSRPTSQRAPNQKIYDRIRLWAGRPESNVHRIIGIVASTTDGIAFSDLVRRVERIGSRNGYGAVRSLMSNAGNAYGRVFYESDGVVRLLPELESEVRSHRWVVP